MLRVVRFRPLLLLALGSLLGSDSARALPRYVEFGGTYAAFADPAPIFTSQRLSASGSASAAFGVPLTLGLQLQNSQTGILFSLALQGRYLMGTSGAGDSFSLFPTSPMLRMELWRFVAGVGYTNAIWNGLSFQRNSELTAMLTLEGQFLFPITPEIDFGLQASRISFTSAGGTPSVIEFGAFFRLNFGFTEASATERKKFKGWRYPLGSPLR